MLVMVEIEPRTFRLQGEHSTDWASRLYFLTLAKVQPHVSYKNISYKKNMYLSSIVCDWPNC